MISRPINVNAKVAAGTWHVILLFGGGHVRMSANTGILAWWGGKEVAEPVAMRRDEHFIGDKPRRF